MPCSGRAGAPALEEVAPTPGGTAHAVRWHPGGQHGASPVSEVLELDVLGRPELQAAPSRRGSSRERPRPRWSGCCAARRQLPLHLLAPRRRDLGTPGPAGRAASADRSRARAIRAAAVRPDGSDRRSARSTSTRRRCDGPRAAGCRPQRGRRRAASPTAVALTGNRCASAAAKQSRVFELRHAGRSREPHRRARVERDLQTMLVVSRNCFV